LQWLEKSLDARLNRPAIVMVHHNPGVREDITGLKDTEELLRLLRPRRHVKALIFGHTHRWTLSRDESGLHLINLPPVAYVFRSGMPSGWVKATMQKSGALLELRCIDPAHPSHGQVKELVWRD
jgi:Icc protein